MIKAIKNDTSIESEPNKTSGIFKTILHLSSFLAKKLYENGMITLFQDH